MSRKLFVSALLVLLMASPAVLSRPPEGPSGQLVQDEVITLKAEVKRLEKEGARDTEKADDLAVARARLAAAQGRMKAAAAEWRKVIALREVQMKRWELLLAKGAVCNPADLVIVRGSFAEARCGLAEVERDRAVLARELPKVIASWEARLAALRTLAKVGAISPDDAEQNEKALLKELRQARERLDALKGR